MDKEYAIFYDAFDIKDPVERRKFIKERSGGDQKLFEGVMRLFPDDELLLDDVYGEFQIKSLLGVGGMGVVYLASREIEGETNNETEFVALKTINPEHQLSTNNIEMFLREIQVLEKLDHPNIARIIKVGTSQNGKPYFVMEYLKGLPITKYCDEHKLSVAERIKYFKQVLDAIGYSHSKGFLHCDITPSNIIVCEDGRLSVIDFGIASKYGEFVTHVERSTFILNAFTPMYASPEQINGGSKLTESSDIYSLGVLLFELLTSRHPVEIDPANNSYLELVDAVNHRPVRSLRWTVNHIEGADVREKVAHDRSVRKIESLSRQMTNGLDDVVQRAIGKKPQHRYASVSALDTALDTCLNTTMNRTLRDYVSSALGRSRRRMRNTSIFTIQAILFSVLVLFGLYYWSSTLQTVPYYTYNLFYGNSPKLRISPNKDSTVDESIFAMQSDLRQSLNKALIAIESSKFQPREVKYNTWSVADFVTALSVSREQMNIDRLDRVFNETDTSDGCWKEESFSCKTIISGWVMLAKTQIGKSTQPDQLKFVLDIQSPDGWFPAYPDYRFESNAGTYPTAFVLLGLTSQYRAGLIPRDQIPAVKKAIVKGAEWLLANQRIGATSEIWLDCPDSDTDSESSSIAVDAAVIFTLQFIQGAGIEVKDLNEDVGKLSSQWLDRLAYLPSFSIEHFDTGRCVTLTRNGSLLDRTVRFTTPWTLAATAGSFPHGTAWQRASAENWLHKVSLDEDQLDNPWGKAEFLISLEVLEHGPRVLAEQNATKN